MKKLAVIALVGLSSCMVQNQDIVRNPSKDGSIETVISIKHFRGYDLLVTTNQIWRNDLIDKTIVHTDTLKTLGTVTKMVDDGFGSMEKKTFPKNYEIYITVK